MSKKEQKKLEDEEFERVLRDLGVKEAQTAAKAEEAKEAVSEAHETDAKKSAANKKKKEKEAAKKAAALKAAEEAKVAEEPLDEAAKKAAIADALKKRQ